MAPFYYQQPKDRKADIELFLDGQTPDNARTREDRDRRYREILIPIEDKEYLGGECRPVYRLPQGVNDCRDSDDDHKWRGELQKAPPVKTPYAKFVCFRLLRQQEVRDYEA